MKNKLKQVKHQIKAESKKEEKKREKRSYKGVRKTIKYYLNYKWLLFGFIATMVVSIAPSVLNPIYEGNIINSFSDFSLKAIIFNTMIVFILWAVSIINNYIQFRISVKISRKVNVDIQRDMVRSAALLNTASYDKLNTGTFVTRVNGDVMEMSDTFLDLLRIITNIVSNFIMLGYVLYLNVYIFLLFVSHILLTYLIEKYRRKYYQKKRKEYRKQNESVIGFRTEIVRGNKDVKSFNIGKNVENLACEQQENIRKFDEKIRTKDWHIFFGSATVTEIMFGSFFIICAFLINYNFLTLATFFVLMNFRGRCHNLVVNLANFQAWFGQAAVAADRVFEVIDPPKDSTQFIKEEFGNVSLSNIEGRIKFNDVEFSYSDDKPLFKNFSFEIEPNSVVALVGKSGQGKSTILALIEKLYKVNSGGGNITIDGVDVNDLDKNSLRDNISLVLQSPYIFNMSIMDNFKLIKPDVTIEEVIDACKKAEIHDYIDSLKDKYDSLLGENGVILSGGQKQRLAIARALLKNSKIILFDEATSSLDNESQAKIKKVFSQLSKDHTIVIVAHRLSTVVDCDKIIFIENNKVVAEGKHKELLKNCKAYKELYESEDL